VASIEWINLVVFCYLSASEIWPDKRDVLMWEWPKGGILYFKSMNIMHHFRKFMTRFH